MTHPQRSLPRALGFAALLATAPAAAQAPPPATPVSPAAAEDLTDFFLPKALDLAAFRDERGRTTLSLRLGDDGALALAGFTTTVGTRTGDRELSVDEAATVAYDPGTRRLAVTFARNEARVREVAGALTAVPREFHHVHRFTGEVRFEGGRVEPVVMTGSANRLRGKPSCVFDMYPGANLAALTLKAAYDPARGEWAMPLAAELGWTVKRRRIDYGLAEDEFDVEVGAGEELNALAAIVGRPEIACLSVGADEGGDGDSLRIIDVPRGRLLPDAVTGGTPSPERLRAVLAAVRLDGVAPTVEVEPPQRKGRPFTVSLRAPGRFFGLTQGAQEAHSLRIEVEAGLSPGRSGAILEALRVSVQDLARGPEPVSLKPGGAQGAAEAVQDWRTRYLEALAASLGGTLS